MLKDGLWGPGENRSFTRHRVGDSTQNGKIRLTREKDAALLHMRFGTSGEGSVLNILRRAHIQPFADPRQSFILAVPDL